MDGFFLALSSDAILIGFFFGDYYIDYLFNCGYLFYYFVFVLFVLFYYNLFEYFGFVLLLILFIY